MNEVNCKHCLLLLKMKNIVISENVAISLGICEKTIYILNKDHNTDFLSLCKFVKEIIFNTKCLIEKENLHLDFINLKVSFSKTNVENLEHFHCWLKVSDDLSKFGAVQISKNIKIEKHTTDNRNFYKKFIVDNSFFINFETLFSELFEKTCGFVYEHFKNELILNIIYKENKIDSLMVEVKNKNKDEFKLIKNKKNKVNNIKLNSLCF